MKKIFFACICIFFSSEIYSEHTLNLEKEILIYKSNVFCKGKLINNWKTEFASFCTSESNREIVIYSDKSMESFDFINKKLQPRIKKYQKLQFRVYKIDDVQLIAKLDKCLMDKLCKSLEE